MQEEIIEVNGKIYPRQFVSLSLKYNQNYGSALLKLKFRLLRAFDNFGSMGTKYRCVSYIAYHLNGLLYDACAHNKWNENYMAVEALENINYITMEEYEKLKAFI